MFKIKYLGGLIVLLLLSFITLLGMSSTCYALTPSNELSKQSLEDIIEYFILNQPNYTGNYTNFNIVFSNFLLNNDLNLAIQDFNSTINTDHFPTLEQLVVIPFYYNNQYAITFIQNNNTIGNSLPHLTLRETYSGGLYSHEFGFLDENDVSTTGYRFNMWLYSDGTYNFSENSFTLFANTINSKYALTFDSNTTTFDTKSILALNYNSNIYVKSYQSSSFSWKWLTNKITVSSSTPPVDPGTGSTGDITDENGNVTGTIDLSGVVSGLNDVQNQISGDTTRIIENQNKNTEQIVSAINNSNENYWGSSGDLTGDEQEEQIEDGFNDIIDSISGELTSNAVFSHLEQAEDIFLCFFKNKEDESFYDLIISWDTISPVFTMFNGSQNIASGSIINGDSINISALCRENPELCKIQQYIRIIFNFGVLIALFWQIYNLVLSTLGIDNPYLYEDAQVTDVVNSDTGEVKSYYRTHKRLFRRR